VFVFVGVVGGVLAVAADANAVANAVAKASAGTFGLSSVFAAGAGFCDSAWGAGFRGSGAGLCDSFSSTVESFMTLLAKYSVEAELKVCRFRLVVDFSLASTASPFLVVGRVRFFLGRLSFAAFVVLVVVTSAPRFSAFSSESFLNKPLALNVFSIRASAVVN